MISPGLCASARTTRRVILFLVLCAAVALVWLSQPRPLNHAVLATTSPPLHWYRGNTHTHTNNSFDGDSSPTAVATRYKQLGYNFVLVTDHNRHTTIDSVNEQVAVAGQFLVIQGEEVTDSFNGIPVHVAALSNTSPINPPHGTDIRNTLQNDIDAVRQAGGLPIIAHPNYRFALSSDDLKNVEGASLFEVFNAHPVVNNFGDSEHPSVEANWDDVLSSGKVLYGLASDDEHTLTNASGALPDRAWIVVRAASLDAGSITAAIASGDFYASTGIALQDYQVSATGVTVTLDGNSSGATIDFIGRNGQLLERTNSSPAVYTFTHHEQYVRAKIYDDLGRMAWTQPIFTQQLNPTEAVVNGASLGNEPQLVRKVAPDSVAMINGIGLASSAIQSQPESYGVFPTSLDGNTVTVNGRAAELYYVSPNKVTFHVPIDTEPGSADLVMTNSDGVVFRTQITVADVAPGIFTVDGSGTGSAVTFDLNKLFGDALIPIDNWRRFYLYGTGVRGGTDVQVWVDGQQVFVDAVRSCRGLRGLDQITIVFPRSIGEPAAVPVVIKVDGITSNTVLLRP
ncbi:MAG TPA: CehA/McbA family metallohydrolase [Pyrinomonadaceae bacterium]|nr:CehA/McbA family metallohydrolase [Pyrinomonadaceae bacterium]